MWGVFFGAGSCAHDGVCNMYQTHVCGVFVGLLKCLITLYCGEYWTLYIVATVFRAVVAMPYSASTAVMYIAQSVEHAQSRTSI